MKLIHLYGSFDYFGFFLILSFVFISSFFIYSANKKYQVPLRISIALCTTTIFFVLFGAKLFTISSEQWLVFFKEGKIPSTDKLTILGALAFIPIGVWVGKKIFQINIPVLDLIAIPLPLGMAIQRLGCFFAGCCYGTTSDHIWAVSYSPYTTAHIHYYNQHLLQNFSDFTPALHPIPLYLILICLVNTIILYFLRDKFSSKGSLFILSISLFIAARCFIEFYRDPSTNGEFGIIWLGLKKIQWFLLISFLFCISLIIYREKKHATTFNSYVFQSSSYKKLFFGLSFIISVITLTHHWFTPLELSCFFLFTTSALFTTIGTYFSEKKVHDIYLLKYAYITGSVLIILPLTAQIAFNNDKDTKPFSYHEVSIGGATTQNFSHYHNHALAEPHQDCNGSTYYSYTYPAKYTHNTYWFGGSYKLNNVMGNYQKFHRGVSLAAAIDSDNDPDHKDQFGKSSTLYDISGNLGFDFKALGIEVGAHLGNNRKPNIQTGLEKNSMSAGKPVFRFLPKAALRIGFPKYIYFDGRVGMQIFGINGLQYPVEIGVATGLGINNGSYIRTAFDPKNLNLCLGAKYIFNNGLGVEANLAENFQYKNYTFNFSTSYLFLNTKK